MEDLLKFINGLPTAERAGFCERCGTTEGYLRKAISVGGRLGESLCINIERETSGAIICEMLRADVDWAYIRATGCDCTIKCPTA
jgi:DNA-binding transcriptional regulator YdaS (Cro superfamily)